MVAGLRAVQRWTTEAPTSFGEWRTRRSSKFAPACAREAQLGAAATGRLQSLLNQGAFTLESTDHDRDEYGRLLRTVTRNGESVGAVLVSEGLAEDWRGYRGSWC